jgi:hypothetical protein
VAVVGRNLDKSTSNNSSSSLLLEKIEKRGKQDQEESIRGLLL